jgi:hypothetical protein
MNEKSQHSNEPIRAKDYEDPGNIDPKIEWAKVIDW